jgi:hypothetical protein|tara:strand:- start:395 stop:586 length:192 start_codon:yes stop_codon:yes gene_type:complete
MPAVDIERNITEIRGKIDQLTQEIYRFQGMLQTFEEFKKAGLKVIDIPDQVNEELDSIQENPE